MRRALASLALGIAILMAPAALAQSAPSDTSNEADTFKPLAIDKNGVLILIRSVLLAVQHANDTGNYSVLRELGAPGFQAANSSAKLATIFANLRQQNVDLSGIAAIEPQLTRLPEVNGRGYMRMAGYFPSAPVQINFDLVFASHAGRWRPFGIAVNLGSAAPVATVPAPEQAVPSAAAPRQPAKIP